MSQGAVQMGHIMISNQPEEGEVEAGAEGIQEITWLMAGLRDATQKRLSLSLAFCCAKSVGTAAPQGKHVAKRMHRKEPFPGT